MVFNLSLKEQNCWFMTCQTISSDDIVGRCLEESSARCTIPASRGARQAVWISVLKHCSRGAGSNQYSRDKRHGYQDQSLNSRLCGVEDQCNCSWSRSSSKKLLCRAPNSPRGSNVISNHFRTFRRRATLIPPLLQLQTSEVCLFFDCSTSVHCSVGQPLNFSPYLQNLHRL